MRVFKRVMSLVLITAFLVTSLGNSFLTNSSYANSQRRKRSLLLNIRTTKG